MLFEKTTYPDDFPISIKIVKIKEYPFHYHRDTELVYVLKGEILLKNVCHNYILKEGDVFTNSGREIHGITATDKENTVAVIQISNSFFTQYFPDLAKSCFMSYVKTDKYDTMDGLRKMLLQILLDYSRKSFNYKNACIQQMIEVIKYLNKHFNLFAFEGKTVVGFKESNPITVGRISRIINYIYENHASKITLQEIAEREHLSAYYLSHLIRNHIGLNFQEFLCFARVEMSEIPLLETDKKISTIARDVGFSTSSYYDKFFSKWFGHTPEEYRKLYTSHVLGPSRPEKAEILSDNQAISIIRRCLSTVSGYEKSSSIVNRLNLTVEADPQISPIAIVDSVLKVIVTCEDYRIMGENLFHVLHELKASNVIVEPSDRGSEELVSDIMKRLRDEGFDVSASTCQTIPANPSAGYDSISEAIRILQTYFTPKGAVPCCHLRDQGEMKKVLKGYPACLTSCMLPKPSFYAYLLLRNVKGELLYWSKYYCVIKNGPAGEESYILAIMNYSEEIQKLCYRNAGVHETNDVINAFKDVLNIDFSIPVTTGKYVVARYALSNENSIFAHMANLGFPETFPLSTNWSRLLNTGPKSQVRIEKSDGMLNISSTVTGAGIQIITVRPADCLE